MPEFFRGRKRKVGVLTLLMALVSLVGWVRSLENRESLYLTLCQVRNAAISIDGKLGVFRSHVTSPERGFVWITLPIASVYGQQTIDATSIFNVVRGNGNGFETRVQFCGVDFGMVRTISDPKFLVPFIFVPYWSIVAPLAAISAWLLFSKPRPATLGESPIDTSN